VFYVASQPTTHPPGGRYQPTRIVGNPDLRRVHGAQGSLAPCVACLSDDESDNPQCSCDKCRTQLDQDGESGGFEGNDRGTPRRIKLLFTNVFAHEYSADESKRKTQDWNHEESNRTSHKANEN
jgi:hypothetical protein